METLGGTHMNNPHQQNLPSKNVFQTCELGFSLPENGLEEDDDPEKPLLMWKSDPKMELTPALHDGLMNDWDRSVQFYQRGKDCENCEKNKLRVHFILAVRCNYANLFQIY